MDTYRFGVYNAQVPATAAPAGAVGLLMSSVGGRYQHYWSTRVKLVATGAVSVNIIVWRRDVNGFWAPLGQNGGDINGGSPFTMSGAGTSYFEPGGGEFLGVHDRIYFQFSNATNLTIASCSVDIAPIAGVS